MRRETLRYVLALSLLFNVGALAAGAYQAWVGGGLGRASLPKYLELDAAQRQRWAALEEPFLAELDTGWRDIARERAVLLTTLFGEAPDAGRVEAARSRIAQLQTRQQQRVIAQLQRERELLHPGQRQKLLELLLRDEQQPASRERKLHGS